MISLPEIALKCRATNMASNKINLTALSAGSKYRGKVSDHVTRTIPDPGFAQVRAKMNARCAAGARVLDGHIDVDGWKSTKKTTLQNINLTRRKHYCKCFQIIFFQVIP